MTIAATLATAPLIAFHFGDLSTTTLARQPAGDAGGGAGDVAGDARARRARQVPGFPVEPLNAVNAPLLAYIAQVAAWCGRPALGLPPCAAGAAGLVASYAAMAAATVVAPTPGRRHRRIAALRRQQHSPTGRRRPRYPSPSARAAAVGFVAVGARRRCAVVWALGSAGGGADAAGPAAGLRVSVLDVGQGDAILLQPAGAPAVLVDGGPPGDGLAAKLRAPGSGGSAPRCHPRSVRPRWRDRGTARALPGRRGSCTAGSASDACAARRAAAGAAPDAARRGRRAALGRAAPRSPLAAARAASRPAPATQTRTPARS